MTAGWIGKQKIIGENESDWLELTGENRFLFNKC